MPRQPRAFAGDQCYHALNRGNRKQQVFFKDGDYQAFLKVMSQACEKIPMRVLAWCLMPNHFHLVLWPYGDGDLSRWMHWVQTAYVARYNLHHNIIGHLWQGRFKAFPIEHDEHLLTVSRYVERNPRRAQLVERAEDYLWSSLRYFLPRTTEVAPAFLHPGPVERGTDWVEWVNQALSLAELDEVRTCVQRGRPFGKQDWTRTTADKLGLQSTLRSQGRPRNVALGSA